MEEWERAMMLLKFKLIKAFEAQRPVCGPG